MDLDTLYLLVTEGIQRADVLEDLNAPGAGVAHLDVSLLEEKIAELIPASKPEGALARRGAVRAAVRACDLQRASDLVIHFAGEPDASDELKEEIQTLLRRGLAAQSPPKKTSRSKSSHGSASGGDETTDRRGTVTFAGERGRQLVVDIQRLSAGVISMDEASSELTRGPDGMIRIKVTKETIELLTSAR